MDERGMIDIELTFYNLVVTELTGFDMAELDFV